MPIALVTHLRHSILNIESEADMVHERTVMDVTRNRQDLFSFGSGQALLRSVSIKTIKTAIKKLKVERYETLSV